MLCVKIVHENRSKHRKSLHDCIFGENLLEGCMSLNSVLRIFQKRVSHCSTTSQLSLSITHPLWQFLPQNVLGACLNTLVNNMFENHRESFLFFTNLSTINRFIIHTPLVPLSLGFFFLSHFN